jgi:PAS domain S-box-containing protein
MKASNDELRALNRQLKEKLQAIHNENNKLTSLLSSSEVAMVFLDAELRIKRFTPPTEKLLKLVPGDVGRPFCDFAPGYHDTTLLESCRRVLDTHTAEEKEIRTDSQHSYLRRILPCRTADNRIDGIAIVFIDITERAASEAKSRMHATLLRNLNEAITMQDFDGSITLWNHGADQMYGYDEAHALNMNIREIVPEDRRAEALQLVDRVAAGEDIKSFETRRLTSDGRTLDVCLNIIPVLDEYGNRIALSTTERDITASNRASEKIRRLNDQLEQKVAERGDELLRREEEFRTLADNVPALFSYIGTDQRYRYVNRRYEQFWGQSAAEVIGMTASELLGPKAYEIVQPHIEAVLAGNPQTYELSFVHDGRVHYVQVNYVPDTDTNGQVQGFFTLANDITELKSAQQALHEREDRLRVIVDTAPDAVITINNEGLINEFNRAAERIFGYSADEVIGHNVNVLMPSPERDEHDGYIVRYLETGESSVFCRRREVVGCRKNGATFPMDLTVSEIDHIGMFVGIARDISAQRQLEQEVAKASTYEQERIGQEIHDGLGQRLTGLSLLAKTLRDELADRELEEAETANEIVEQLHRAIEEVRAIAHGLSPLPLVLGVLEDALARLAEDTQATTGIICNFERQAGESSLIEDRTAAMQLYRIAQEAMHNAVKHAHARTITLTLGERGHLPELVIKDDGCGFEVDNIAGEGIGLRLMGYRASIIGCNLMIESAPDKGTCIRCKLGSSVVRHRNEYV